jgi:hypothetical protein
MRAICPGKLAGTNAHKLAIFRAFPLEPDMAIFFREQGVIATNTDVYSGMEARTALANENIASQDFLAAVHLDTESWGLLIAPRF